MSAITARNANTRGSLSVDVQVGELLRKLFDHALKAPNRTKLRIALEAANDLLAAPWAHPCTSDSKLLTAQGSKYIR